MDDRGQALTLEGALAAVLIVLSLLFALQVSAVTPLTESTSSQHIENQQQRVAANVLEIAAEDEMLRSTVLYWDPPDNEEEEGGFVESSEMGTYTGGIPTDTPSNDVSDFGSLLYDSFSDRGIAYNMYVNYIEEEDGTKTLERKQIVDQGQPSAHAVSVSNTVTLYEHNTIYDVGPLRDNEGDFYAKNIGENVGETNVYNVVEVELVIWRM